MPTAFVAPLSFQSQLSNLNVVLPLLPKPWIKKFSPNNIHVQQYRIETVLVSRTQLQYLGNLKCLFFPFFENIGTLTFGVEYGRFSGFQVPYSMLNQYFGRNLSYLLKSQSVLCVLQYVNVVSVRWHNSNILNLVALYVKQNYMHQEI